jgi:hypothetical protein
MLRLCAVWCLILAAVPARSAETYTFDATAFQKKTYEINGYVEVRYDHFRLNGDGSQYQLNNFRTPRATLERTAVLFKPSGKLRAGSVTMNARAHLEYQQDILDSERTQRFDEFYLSFKPNPGFTLDAGKTALKWGKGYAWNPVGFIERPKDPNDPELAREGFTALSADIIRNFDGPLQTVAFTPVLLPARAQLNGDFGQPGHNNVAVKLYLLYRDTDIDFMFLSNGSRTQRFGFDFSRNLSSNLELHGEWARVDDVQRRVTDVAGNVTVSVANAYSYLLGVRYLTEREMTLIAEYYRNGGGFSDIELRGFYQLTDSAYRQFLSSGVTAPLQRAQTLSQSGYGRPNAGRHYFYLRASQKEPFGILYFTPSVALIANLDDRSVSVAPEMLYTGITNVELRLRAFFLNGGNDTEFGEKQNRRRMELMARFYF